MDLDVQNPAQVSGHSVLRADLGGGRTLVVMSGIAVPEWRIDDENTHRDIWRVLLHEPAEDLEQTTVTVGLASISNDDSAWVFATDGASLEVDEVGNLRLVVPMALAGEASFLHRFSYQVVATVRHVPSIISGTLTWQTSMLRPASSDATEVARVFTVMANERTVTQPPAPTGPEMFPIGPVEHLTPVSQGVIVQLDISDQTCAARYQIPGAPVGREIKVTVAQSGLVHAEPTLAAQVPGSEVFTLTPAQPSRTGVDFEAVVPGHLG